MNIDLRQFQAFVTVGRLGPGATFPISGYTRTADWGGSAVVDFTLLDLIFSHGLSPADAVAKTRQMLSFARDRSDQRDPIALLQLPGRRANRLPH